MNDVQHSSDAPTVALRTRNGFVRRLRRAGWRRQSRAAAQRPEHRTHRCKHCGSYGTTEDKRHFAAPPDIRARRGQPLIPEIPGLSEWLEEQFQQVPRPSFRTIEERLKQTPFWTKIRAAGFRTGKSSIHTHWVRWNAEVARKRVVAEYSAAYNASGNAADTLDIEAAISGLANVAIFEELQQELSEGKGVSSKAAALIDLHRKLQASSARREAERRAAGVNARKAYEAARGEIVAILEGNPDALRLVLAAIDNAQKKTEEKAA